MGLSFGLKLKMAKQRMLPRPKVAMRAAQAEAFELMAKAQAVGDVNWKIIRAMGVPTGGSEQGIPGTERGDLREFAGTSSRCCT